MNKIQMYVIIPFLVLVILFYTISSLYHYLTGNHKMELKIIDGDVIYYSTNTGGGGIYRLDVVSKERKKISSNRAIRFYDQNEFLYYKKIHSSDIYRIDKGDFSEKLISSNVNYLEFFDGIILFIENNSRRLYAISLDGKTKKEMTDYPISKFRIRDNKVYIYDEDFSVIEIERSTITIE